MFRKCLASVMCVVLACGCVSNGFKDATASEAVIQVGDLSLGQASVAEDLPEESSSSTADVPEDVPVADGSDSSTEVLHQTPTESDGALLAESEIPPQTENNAATHFEATETP
ncbi:MAG: hypothetical protein LBT59_13735, partial [Clostridiales bacterium]|nr:hypothetical protein [Clostridiales bacterium]